MAAWCFDKKDISNSPSFQMGVEPDVEARYRREGARFINNVGQKLGLRFDTCATGVTYFHRFYMFHSFKEFNRYVIGTACLFLAGKVEETPKKCRDLIKAAQSFLSEQQLATFGEDPKEEVMTMERILLQTIKFDLQVEHPYTYLLKYAKTFKGDKAKIQKVVQMAWAFSNDSLCTTLCLQWEPEIIAIALIHLACRLTKFEIQDWQGKLPSQKGKWWDQFVEDISLKLLEDICHQVLDLYSQVQNKEVASPTAAAVGSHGSGGGESSTSRRASMGGSSSNASSTPASPAVKVQSKAYEAVAVGGGSLPEPLQSSSGTTPASSSATVVGSAAAAAIASGAALPQLTGQLSVSGGAAAAAVTTYAGHYIPQQLYTSSFLSSEGTQSLASLIGSQQLPFGGAPLPPSPLPPHPMSQPFPGAPYPGNGGPFGGPQQYYPGPPLPGSSFGAASPHPPLPPTPGPAAGPGGFPAFAGLIGGAPPYPGMPHGYGFPGPVPSDYHPPLPPPHHHPGVNLGRGGSHRGNHRGGGNVGGGGAGGGGGEGSQQHDGKSNKQNLSLRSSLVQIV